MPLFFGEWAISAAGAILAPLRDLPTALLDGGQLPPCERIHRAALRKLE